MTKRPATLDDTPLPHAVPHHIADPTARIESLDRDLFGDDDDAPDERGSDEYTIPEVVRRGGELDEGGEGVDDIDDEDLSESVATRQRPRIDPDELEKLLALDGVPADGGDDDQTRPRPTVDEE